MIGVGIPDTMTAKLVISADTDSKIPVKSKYDELFEGMEERPINIF